MKLKNKFLLLHIKTKKYWHNVPWSEIKNQIETTSDNSGEYKKKIIKIKFDSNYNLPLNRILKLHTLIIVVRFVFQEVSKYYPKYFLDECLYEL